ncbi:MAG: hypothetical protein Alis3KO_05310 [Aliiglaciecola sp.]
MKKVFSSFAALTSMSIGALCHAQTIEISAIEEKRLDQNIESAPLPKFLQWGDNEILARYSDGAKTRRHFDVSLGFRYLMTNSFLPKNDNWEYALALAYQGEFDFFALTRQSSPVVTTRHNPSLFYTRFRNPEQHRFSSLFVSLEHESNGQVTDNLVNLQAEIDAYSNDYQNDLNVTPSDVFEMAQQTISRSNNFVGFGFNYQLGNLNGDCDSIFSCTNMQVKFRYQLDGSPEDELWWIAEQRAELKDYVGSKVDVETKFVAGDVPQALRLTYQTGQLVGARPFKRNTFDIRYYIDVPVGRIASKLFNLEQQEAFAMPLVIRYHNGYLDELYNYSMKVSYFAIGLHARY